MIFFIKINRLDITLIAIERQKFLWTIQKLIPQNVLKYVNVM